MSLYEELDQSFKSALKKRDDIRVSVLRLIRTAIKNKEVQARRKLEDKEILSLISTQTKQRREAIDQFEQGGRTDLVKREKAELEILQSYLPQQLDLTEIEAAVAGIIDEEGAQSMKDMGRVMKIFMARYAGQADGKMVNEVVKDKLSS